ncbi:hypothetical protein [Paenibacillus gorillae]|uniref:hypothetical protein n=1 Tax=Paenibacillus gorillae TaxID=1243662 RepID=UPI0004B3EA69|nr:hypothetical protein [Paenibacillus gorillae]
MNMRMAKPYLAGLLAALAVTLVLAWLPHLHKETGRDVSVFHPTPATKLTNSNLVDAMVGLQLSGQLAKVEWKHTILSVEMKLPDAAGQSQRWAEDMEKLIRLSFLQMDNVSRILLRYVEGNEQGTSRLLFAIDVRKGDNWLLDEIDQLSQADPIHDERWRERLRISFTSAWEQRFGPAESYTAVPLKKQEAVE